MDKILVFHFDALYSGNPNTHIRVQAVGYSFLQYTAAYKAYAINSTCLGNLEVNLSERT